MTQKQETVFVYINSRSKDNCNILFKLKALNFSNSFTCGDRSNEMCCFITTSLSS